MEETRRLHDPIPDHGQEYPYPCNGIGTLRTNPYLAEIKDIESWEWFCECGYRETCADI